MENCSSPSKNINTRKQAIRRRSSFGLIAEDLNIRLYSQDDLKMFVFLCLINRFEEQKQKCLQSYDKQAEAKLNKTGTHFNRTSSTIIIEPLKKQAIQLKSTSLILQQLSQIIQQNLLNQFKKSSKRRSHNVTTSAFNQLVMTQSAEQTAVNSRVLATSTSNQLKSNLSNINDVSPRTKTLIKANIQKGKQNVGRNSQSRQIFHRRMISSEVGSSKFSLKQNHDSAKRQKFFMLRKKQQLNFLNKITFNFSSQEAEFKAMVEVMQIFLKNLSRSNYYLKVIDQSITKNHKIVVYIQQLLKVFSNIISIFTQLSGQHKVLNLKQCEPVIKSQISYLLPLIQQYYEKSNETIKIMRHFSVSPIFATFMTPQKDKCSKLITLFVQARYLLRYMEKEIENLEPKKKDSKNIPKWQRAFRVKFLPKNSLF